MLDIGTQCSMRKKLKESMEEHANTNTPYRAVVQKMKISDTALALGFCHPLALLYHISSLSTTLQSYCITLPRRQGAFQSFW